MLDCYHREVLNNFSERYSHFNFAPGPANYVADLSSR